MTDSAAGNKMQLGIYRMEASEEPRGSIILIHNIGRTSASWSHFLRYIENRDADFFNTVNMILPTAPMIPIKDSEGQLRYSWYDHPFNAEEALQGHDAKFGASVEKLDTLIKRELDAGIPPSKIIVGGFSMGSTMALALALCSKYKVGGVFAISGMVPYREQIEEMMTTANCDTPIFHAHGSEDPAYPLKQAQSVEEFMQQHGHRNYKLKVYQDLAHIMSPEVTQDVFDFCYEMLDLQRTGKPAMWI